MQNVCRIHVECMQNCRMYVEFQNVCRIHVECMQNVCMQNVCRMYVCRMYVELQNVCRIHVECMQNVCRMYVCRIHVEGMQNSLQSFSLCLQIDSFPFLLFYLNVHWLATYMYVSMQIYTYAEKLFYLLIGTQKGNQYMYAKLCHIAQRPYLTLLLLLKWMKMPI